MASNDTLHIDLKAALSSGGPQEHCLTDAFFSVLEQDEIQGGALRVRLSVAEKAGEYFQINYTVAGEVRVQCDRCLDDLVYDVELSDSVLVYGGDGEPANDEAKMLPPRSYVYDLSWDVYESVVLSLPLQRVHAEAECNSAMVKYLLGQEDAGEDAGDSGN